MLLSVLSLSRGFTEPCNYSSVERSCLLCLTLMSVINMIPHLCEKGYTLWGGGDDSADSLVGAGLAPNINIWQTISIQNPPFRCLV